MVGPGEVDDDLEPEVKEECNGKYGDVLSVNVIELPDPPRPEEAVRIFIEFKKVAAAIKGKLRYKKAKAYRPKSNCGSIIFIIPYIILIVLWLYCSCNRPERKIFWRS